MKRGVAILLTTIMLLTGIQSVLSLHLCGGTLFSVSFHEESESGSCCEMPMQAPQEISARQRQSATNASSRVDVFHEDCCDFQTLEISTDDFSHDVAQQSTQLPTPLTYAAWATITSLLQPVISDTSLHLRQLFPPVGLSRITTDLLTFICIYRI